MDDQDGQDGQDGQDDQDGLRELYAAAAARLVAQLYAVTGDYGAAQDAVQEAFVRALDRPGRLRRLDNPEAWLRTVALNAARSQHRRRVLLDRILRSGRLHRQPTLPELSPNHVALVAALQRLSRPIREAVVLHHIGDLPVSQVASALGCSESAVKNRLMRGRQALAAYLTEHEPPVGPAANGRPPRAGSVVPVLPEGETC